MTAYRIRRNDGPEYTETPDGRIDLTADEVREVIERKRHFFDPLNSPEPYAPWGLSLYEVIEGGEDEDGPYEKPIDWRALERPERHIGYAGRTEEKFRWKGDSREIKLEISATLATSLLGLLESGAATPWHVGDSPLTELRDVLRSMTNDRGDT